LQVLALIQKTNDDWWRILKQNGQEGFVPANYCQIVPDETVCVFFDDHITGKLLCYVALFFSDLYIKFICYTGNISEHIM
jgi:hypothetical protein